jgi:hypothetical protein
LKPFAPAQLTSARFSTVTRARATLQRRHPGAAANERGLSSALGRLFAVAEAYPDLKPAENFLRLQETTDTEDKISAAHRYYNSTVMPNSVQTSLGARRQKPGFREKEFSPPKVTQWCRSRSPGDVTLQRGPLEPFSRDHVPGSPCPLVIAGLIGLVLDLRSEPPPWRSPWSTGSSRSSAREA